MSLKMASCERVGWIELTEDAFH